MLVSISSYSLTWLSASTSDIFDKRGYIRSWKDPFVSAPYDYIGSCVVAKVLISQEKSDKLLHSCRELRILPKVSLRELDGRLLLMRFVLVP